MSVGRIATRVVATASPRESVLDIARRMEEHNVGSVVIVDEASKPVGIITDRDIVVRAAARDLDLDKTPVSMVMTREVRTVDESTPIEQALATMGAKGSRRLVVTGSESKLVGLLSLDDVIELLAEEAESVGALLRNVAPSLTTSS